MKVQSPEKASQHKSRILQNNSTLQKRDMANYSATNAPVLPSSVFIHKKVKAQHLQESSSQKAGTNTEAVTS